MTFSNTDSENLGRIATALEAANGLHETSLAYQSEHSKRDAEALEIARQSAELQRRASGEALSDEAADRVLAGIRTGLRLVARRFLLHPAVAKPDGVTFEGVEFTDGRVVVARSDGMFAAYEYIEQMFSTWHRDSIEWID